MLRFLVPFIMLSCLHSQINYDINERAQSWYSIQQQLVSFYEQYNQFQNVKMKNYQEFFNIQQQLAALYFAQRRYHLGFGTALLPSECAVHNYVRKKTFLTFKLKELLPLYKKYANDYQKKYISFELQNNQKKIQELEKLNRLHLKFFDEFKKAYKAGITPIEKISSIKEWVKQQPVRSIKTNKLLNWVTPVAGISQSPSQSRWIPLDNAIVLCPDSGVVTAVGEFNNTIAVCIKQNRFTYVISGLSLCCINKNDELKQYDIIGFCAPQNPAFIELQLWRDDVILDPSPYHKAIQL